MTDSNYTALRKSALDVHLDIEERSSAIAQLVELCTRDAADALLVLGSRQGEDNAVLWAAGVGLARLQASGVDVSEWDVRDLTPTAAEAFLE